MSLTTQQALDMMCETCRTDVESVFSADPRPNAVIAGDLFHNGCCFVADEIRFLDGGRLIFSPSSTRPSKEDYCRTYFVVCRKLVIIGGGKPLPFDVRGTEHPDDSYKRKNLISWKDRLTSATAGPPPNPDQAAKGSPDWDRNVWTSAGPGDNGADGGVGVDGVAGNPGANGLAAPDFCLVCLEIQFGDGSELSAVDSHLVIDFDGQVGGTGGRGQHSGPGGEGMGGRKGESDNAWPGEGCDRDSGHGGDGGDHGNGGNGGGGGRGGDGGDIYIISTLANVTTGGLVSGKVTYVNDGGNEGPGGLGGFGEPAAPTGFARAGRGGQQAVFHCSAGQDGEPGGPGWPPREPLKTGSEVNQGPEGAGGAAGGIFLREIISDDCTDPLPISATIDGVEPDHLCRGFSSAASNLPLKVNGQHLGQVTGVSFSLAGVSATILPTSSDTELDLLVDIASGSGLGATALTLDRGLGGPMNFPAALTINRYEVTGIAPASAPRGNVVAVTISGTCFDPTAVLQQVSVSGIGISVGNVLVINENTVTCELDISGSAPPSQRDVTVVTGTQTHTLTNAFNVTL